MIANSRHYGKSRIMSAGRMVNGRPTELVPQNDSRKSFYGKATVVEAPDGTLTLYSYNTPVTKITPDGNVEMLSAWDSSQTTLRHVKEFLKQNGFSAGSVAELRKLYGARSIRASVNASADPFKLIERSRYGFINEWDEIAEENEATPDTSWDNIFDNALDEFKRYADDEASGFLLDKFRSGEINEGYMLDEFEQFVMFSDLDDFDF